MDFYKATTTDKECLKPKFDMINFERQQRQFINELAMKRGQVEEMKKELDCAKLKIHELTRALDDSKRSAEEYHYKLTLALKSVRFVEDNLQQKRESVIKTKLQQEAAAAERESLQELLQKSEMQNYELVRKVNELQAQHNCDLAYQKELMDEDAKIRSQISQLTIAMQKIQADQSELIKISNISETCEELQKSVEFYREEYYKCKRSFSNISDKLVIANATVEKFQTLTLDDSFDNRNETQIIIQQWEKAVKRFNENEKLQNEVINNLTEALRTEKENNIKICLHQSNLEDKNHLLQVENEKLKKVLNLRKDHKESEVIIKDEVIEIISKDTENESNINC